ncbi:uncharacterized protein LOC144168262 [Haemaphysalis longicornis]
MEEQEDDSPRAREDDQESRTQGGISVAVRLRRCTERIDRLEKHMDAFEHRHRHLWGLGKELGYHRTTVKGRDLLDVAADAGFTHHTDTAAPTRIGTSVTRDTNPDLAFVRTRTSAKKGVEWRNTGHNMGSDHFIIELDLPTSAVGSNGNRRKHKLTDWTRFRAECLEPQGEITDIEKWSEDIVQATSFATTGAETDEDVQQIDSRLTHMIKRVAELGRAIDKYSRELCAQQWHATCSEADGQLHQGRTWKLLRHLLDETKSKGYHKHRLAQIMHTTIKKLGQEETCKRLNERYLPSTPCENHDRYHGPANPTFDRDIDESEVRAALQNLNRKSAAGPDCVTNKALRNLNDGAIAALMAYFNRFWRAGTLPRQWKAARTILIPKPDEGLYPDAMLGFRGRLSTQDAMVLLQHDILDVTVPTQDNRAVLGLDLQSAFDKVRHSAILAQVSRLGLGERTYNFIRNFLSHRTVEIQAGDVQLPERELGSVGTPQGSVISLVLFNLLMIGVAQQLSGIPQVRYTIYADAITLWVPGGSDDHIETTLQEAVDAIEDHLANTGLRCSPRKSELLIIPPPGRYRKKAEEDSTTITLRTSDGTVITKVSNLRVLGMLLEASRSNGATVDRVITKLGITTRLIKRISTRRHGTKETSLLRLVQ